jgi:hypothetical protein
MYASLSLPMKAEDYKKKAREWKPSPFNFRGNPANKEFVQAFQKENKFKTEGEALDFILLAFQQANEHTKALTEKIAELESLKSKLQADWKKADNENAENENRLRLSIELADMWEAKFKNLEKAKASEESFASNIVKSDFDKKLDAILLKYKENIITGEEPEDVLPEEKKFIEENEEAFKTAITNRLLNSVSTPQPTDSALLLTKHAEFTAFKEELEVKLPKMLKIVGVPRIPISDGDMLRLLVDYCHRDPSQEFPFLPIAKEIFEKFKASQNEQGTEQGESGNQTGDTTGNTGNENGPGNDRQ